MDFVVTRAPFRISFAGGGTDLPSFYKEQDGSVISTTINKYVYVIINYYRPLLSQGIDHAGRYRIRLSYSSTEYVEKPDELQHPIVREALKLLDLDQPMDIATMADVPAGTGLGSSGAFAVALLQALHLIKGENASREQLAEEAAHVEINLLGRPVGKQDHYAAAFGGLNMIHFLKDGDVEVRPLRDAQAVQKKLFPNLMLLFTGVSRDASTILSEQRENTVGLTPELLTMREHAHQLEKMFGEDFCAESFGRVLHETWLQKRKLAATISNGQIDQWYDRAIKAGALGGKISGAGGGGFLLLVVEPDRRESVRAALKELDELPIGFEPQGSQALLPVG